MITKITFSKSDVESLLKQQVLKKKTTHTHTHTQNKIEQNPTAHQSLEVLNLCSMEAGLINSHN